MWEINSLFYIFKSWNKKKRKFWKWFQRFIIVVFRLEWLQCIYLGYLSSLVWRTILRLMNYYVMLVLVVFLPVKLKQTRLFGSTLKLSAPSSDKKLYQFIGPISFFSLFSSLLSFLFSSLFSFSRHLTIQMLNISDPSNSFQVYLSWRAQLPFFHIWTDHVNV